MPTFETPYGTVDAPTLDAAQKWMATQKGSPAASPAAPPQQSEGVLDRFWEGLKAGWSEQHFPDASHIPGGAIGAIGALPSRMVYRGLQGAAETIDMPRRVFTGEQQITGDPKRDIQVTLPTAMVMAGQGWRAPRITMAEPNAGLAGEWRSLTGNVGDVMRDTRGGVSGGGSSFEAPVPGGGSAMPAAPQPLPPQIPPGMQPAIRGGQAMPEQRPGMAPSPGGAAIAAPARPMSPTIPPGMQPAIRGGQAFPEQRPGVPPAPGGNVMPFPSSPVIPPGQQPPFLTGQALPKMRPGEPAPPGGYVSDATVSPLAKALATGDPAAVDRTLTRAYRRAVRPEPIGQPSEAGLKTQDARIVTAFDQIIANRRNLQLVDQYGNPWRGLPRSLRQFSDALDQTKGVIFRDYDQMARAAGGQGVRVDLMPAVNKLRQVAESPQVADLHPAVRDDALRLAQTLEARRVYSPSEAQDVIQNLNKTLQGFWRAPTHETVSRSTMLAPVLTILRGELDRAIESAQGPGYQALRNRYQALRSVEKDVAVAVQREANRIPGGLPEMLGDLAATEEFLRGVVTINPEALGRTVSIKGAQRMLRYINDPNRAVARMFDRRASRGQLPPARPFSPLATLGAGIGASPPPQPQRPPRLGIPGG